MPAFLLIGIPLIVAVLMFGIMTLPDEDKQKDKKKKGK